MGELSKALEPAANQHDALSKAGKSKPSVLAMTPILAQSHTVVTNFTRER